MDRPSTATEAADALVTWTNPHGRPYVAHYGRAGEDFLTALTRTPAEAIAPLVAEQTRAHWLACSGLVGSLPAVLVTWPELGQVGALMNGHPDPKAVADQFRGLGYPVGVGLAEKRYRDGERVRRLVLAAPEDTPPYPVGTRALVVSVLAARSVAADLDKWAGVLPARQAQRVEAEAGTYRAYADATEPLIGPSFAWADDLENPAGTPAFPYVPATLRGSAVLGRDN